ncbi:hypothetical protein [Pyxidicoccus xibeiensis]|uniref:hypothetical protein n=1 Tax=Pyxidicoccus xibeiensis TaxID=2906759 RepID=UPI0020A837A7|nr:hypothetical protein [Pyxidicoccus xibeiensis]MCP3141935.1 hypothetical protein [Pyxidicoccus xibeiensis]
MTLLILGALLASDAVAAPVRLRTQIECLAEEVECKAVEAAMAVGIKAERLGSAAADAYDFELLAKVQPVAVFFELRDRKGIRLIAHTDVAEYRAPHAASDTLVSLGFVTLLFAPLAYELHQPTTLADRSRAWTLMTRRVIRQGIRGGKSYVGAREARSKQWRVEFGTPEVRRKRVLADYEVLAQDSDFELATEGSDEVLEATYSVSLLLPELVSLLDSAESIEIGDGKATLVVQMIEGRFHPSLQVRGNAALSRTLPRSSKHVPPRARAISLPGATRVLVPVTLRRR